MQAGRRLLRRVRGEDPRADPLRRGGDLGAQERPWRTSPIRSLGGAVDFGTEAGVYQDGLGVPVVVRGPGSKAQDHTPPTSSSTRGQLAAGVAFVAGLLRELGRPG